jgi:hypothetical protein
MTMFMNVEMTGRLLKQTENPLLSEMLLDDFDFF